jgi:mannosyltransferase
MGFVQRVMKRMPSAPQLPLGDETKGKTKITSRLAFFRRPLRLKGNSSISIPLGVVLLFPCIVVVLILVLFVRHPKSGVGILMPAGAPPAIRYVAEFLPSAAIVGVPRQLTVLFFLQEDQ